MSIRQFELFHGAVLTKLVRRDKPVTLRLIETNMDDSWSAYKINDVDVFFKHSSSPNEPPEMDGRRWVFTFAQNQLDQIHGNTPHLALVCGSRDIESNMEICFIENSDVSELLSNNAQAITVRLEPGHSFRVSSSAVIESIIIARNAIDTYEVPA